ncbi:histidinol dehydrogenase [Endozoicomonas sp. SCSIO W0465]|uniref:histidinol dehydrogenase n=1 Tax=Endozoicomonas sp. SCSIO W0465 TaxID=2918516 RepID=UPI0035323652
MSAISEIATPIQLDFSSPEFSSQLDALLAWDSVSNNSIQEQVKAIIDQVRKQKDQAVMEYTRRFDKRHVTSVDELTLDADRLQQALNCIQPEQRAALETAANRIRDYHQHQQQNSWNYRESDGTLLGQQVMPMDRVGLYVPGGRASYPSSVLMNAIPAAVAGVPEVVMVVPAPEGELNELVLAAAAIAGVSRVFTIGGAQAVAALAYGTETIPQVDKIVGPGNIYVATAKREVFGQVGIDIRTYALMTPINFGRR